MWPCPSDRPHAATAVATSVRSRSMSMTTNGASSAACVCPSDMRWERPRTEAKPRQGRSRQVPWLMYYGLSQWATTTPLVLGPEARSAVLLACPPWS
jgi:hypothetical protein